MAMYETTPWLVPRHAASTKAVGIRISALYLISDRTGKAVFADGVINMLLYRIVRLSERDPVRQKVHQWSFDHDQALPWRVSRKSWMGSGYQFDLIWPAGVDLSGSEIALIAEYERTDGRVVRSSEKHFRVPGRR
jgi:hypothetical protein